MSDAPSSDSSLYCDDYISLVRNLADDWNASQIPTPPSPERFYEIEQVENFEGELWEREKASYGAEGLYSGISLVGIEHIAGPTCKEDRGYNGHSVTVAETRGCTTYQMLARKEFNWKGEEGDQEWEEGEDWFLTGIGDRFPSRDMASPSVVPVRHGWDEGETDVYGFHVCSLSFLLHPIILCIRERVY